MRASRRFAQQPVIWKWDVFERPYYTWDVYERMTDSFEIKQMTAGEAQAYNPIIIPFTAGHLYTFNSYSGIFNSATGKFDFELSSYYGPITGGSSSGAFNNSIISDSPGLVVDRVFFMYFNAATKNTTLGQWECISSIGYYGVPKWKKGDPTGNTVTSFNGFTYPTNGYHVATELYYIRTTYTKTPVGAVFSLGDDTYPQNGYDEVTDLWYERRAL